MTAEPTFMDFVQLHERKWGETQYPGRPVLADLLRIPIVAMWVHQGRFMFSVHEQASELNQIVHSALAATPTNAPWPWKLAKVFVNQREIEFEIRIVSTVKEQKHVAKETTPLDDHSDLVPLKHQPEVAPLKRQPVLVKHQPRIVTSRPEFIGTYVDDHDRFVAAGNWIKSVTPRPVLPGEEDKCPPRWDDPL